MKRAPINNKEKLRRARVVHGWSFRKLSWPELEAIRAYINGYGPPPPEYVEVDKVVK